MIPHQTTHEQIREFAETAEGWKDNPEARDGGRPSGLYCPNGCMAVHADFPPPWPPG